MQSLCMPSPARGETLHKIFFCGQKGYVKMNSKVHEMNHPLIMHKISMLRSEGNNG